MSVQAEVSVLSFTRGDRAATVQIEGRTLGGSVSVTVAPANRSGTWYRSFDTPRPVAVDQLPVSALRRRVAQVDVNTARPKIRSLQSGCPH